MRDSYFGKVCDRHAALRGERYASDRSCVGCRATAYIRKTKDVYGIRTAAKAAGLKRYDGRVCAKHPKLRGLRIVANRMCVACHAASVAKNAAKNMRAWRSRKGA